MVESTLISTLKTACTLCRDDQQGTDLLHCILKDTKQCTGINGPPDTLLIVCLEFLKAFSK